MSPPLRILHVNKYVYRRGGAESYMLDLAERQAERGHDVALFGMHHPENRDPRVPLTRSLAPLVELAPPPPGLGARLRTATAMVHNRAAATALEEAIDQHRPDVVHLHNIYHQLTPSVLAPARAAGARIVMTLHDYKLACPSYRLLSGGTPCTACVGHSTLNAVRQRCQDGSVAASAVLAIESAIHRWRGAYDAVDRFLCPSRFLFDIMVEAGIGAERLRVVPNPVLVGAGEDIVPAPAQPPVVFAGRLAPEKGLDVVLDVARRLPGRRFVIAGTGPEGPQLEAAAASLANVEPVGQLDRQDLLALLASAAVTLVPSRWFENQPLVVLESYAVGTPVVALRLGGLIEMVDDGVDGALVDPADGGGFATAVERYAADGNRSRRHGERGRIRVVRDHAPEAHLDAVERIYRNHDEEGTR